MRSVVQRVAEAKVSIEGKIIAAIGQGILVLLGIEAGDTESDVEYLVDKLVNLRIFEDEKGKMNRSVLQVAGEILVVSQFTLLADTGKGRRPSFGRAESPLRARSLYEYFLRTAAGRVKSVAAGEFQAMMKVHLVNDGPVTFLVESKKRSGDPSS